MVDVFNSDIPAKKMMRVIQLNMNIVVDFLLKISISLLRIEPGVICQKEKSEDYRDSKMK